MADPDAPTIARTLRGEAPQATTAYQPAEVADDAARRARLAAQRPEVSPEVQALLDAALAAGDSEDDEASSSDLERTPERMQQHQQQQQHWQDGKSGSNQQSELDSSTAADLDGTAPDGTSAPGPASQQELDLALAEAALAELDAEGDADAPAAQGSAEDGGPDSEEVGGTSEEEELEVRSTPRSSRGLVQ